MTTAVPPPLNKDQAHNQALWDRQATDYAARFSPTFRADALSWGAFGVPKSVSPLGDLAGLDVLELGSGAGYRCVAMAGEGARCVGLDISAGMLGVAAANTSGDAAVGAGANGAGANVAGTGSVSWLHAPATAVPCAGLSVDIIVSDFGGLTYDDPAQVLPECARVLRSGGRLFVNTASPLAHMCLTTDGDAIGPTLRRSHDTLGRQVDADGVTWVLSHGQWLALFALRGFRVDALHELPLQHTNGRALKASVSDRPWYRRFPAEDLWCLTKI